MIRLTIIVVIISSICAFSFRDWYKALCGLIAFMAINEHPDIPFSIAGIQGLNPWNLMTLCILFGYLRDTTLRDRKLDTGVVLCLSAYLVVMLTSTVRQYIDLDTYYEHYYRMGAQTPSIVSLVSDDWINTYKWLIPGYLVYRGANTESRIKYTMLAVMVCYTVLAVQIVRWVPFDLDGDKAMKALAKNVGYFRTDLSMMMSMGAWAALSLSLVVSKWYSRSLMVLFVFLSLAMVLTGGRNGMLTWLIVGGVWTLLKKPSLLLWAPALVVVGLLVIPGLYDRVTTGFDSEDAELLQVEMDFDVIDSRGINWYKITSGRVVAWQLVMEKVSEKPLVGYGRRAMKRTGLSADLYLQYSESFPHPHNAYLQLIFDTGWPAALLIFLFYLVLLSKSLKLFRSKNLLEAALGGMAFSTVATFLTASIGAQSFYPVEGMCVPFVVIGMLLGYAAKAEVAIDALPQSQPVYADELAVVPLWQRKSAKY